MKQNGINIMSILVNQHKRLHKKTFLPKEAKRIKRPLNGAETGLTGRQLCRVATIIAANSS